LASEAGQDIGCLLVNLHPEVRHAEIIYLALVPEVRGRQLGKLLVRQAQWLARQAGCERLVLAVDAANDPAILMYGATGFVEWDRRSVWVRALPAGASS
jgi:ribosomal protein S18 acetylase RimI-like enzyme